MVNSIVLYNDHSRVYYENYNEKILELLDDNSNTILCFNNKNEYVSYNRIINSKDNMFNNENIKCTMNKGANKIVGTLIKIDNNQYFVLIDGDIVCVNKPDTVKFVHEKLTLQDNLVFNSLPVNVSYDINNIIYKITCSMILSNDDIKLIFEYNINNYTGVNFNNINTEISVNRMYNIENNIRYIENNKSYMLERSVNDNEHNNDNVMINLGKMDIQTDINVGKIKEVIVKEFKKVYIIKNFNNVYFGYKFIPNDDLLPSILTAYNYGIVVGKSTLGYKNKNEKTKIMLGTSNKIRCSSTIIEELFIEKRNDKLLYEEVLKVKLQSFKTDEEVRVKYTYISRIGVTYDYISNGGMIKNGIIHWYFTIKPMEKLEYELILNYIK